MEERAISGHSEKIRNYLNSIIEVGEPVEIKEFKETYKKLSEGRRKGYNANQSYRQLKKEKIIKFF